MITYTSSSKEGTPTPRYITCFENANGQELSLTSSNIGSVFCSPATSYQIRITMKDGVERTVDISLKDLKGNDLESSEDAKGQLFIINLYFKPFDIVEGKSNLYYWNNKNEDLHLQ